MKKTAVGRLALLVMVVSLVAGIGVVFSGNNTLGAGLLVVALGAWFLAR